MKSFDSFNFLPSILKTIKSKGYRTPTPIQSQAIEHILHGKDLLGIAQTGTGKTAAFSLPIIHNLSKTPKKIKPKCMRILILTPTRELATQIEENIKDYSQGLNMNTKVIFGGVGPTNQIKALKAGLHFVVATPGRLLDLVQSKDVNFEQLEVFVLDEADRMLDMGFINDIKKIIQKLPKQRQTLLFSATMPKEVEKLAQKFLSHPIKVEVTPESTTIEKIEQSVSFLAKNNKIKLLIDILNDSHVNSALVFTRTKHGADRLVRLLEKNNIKSRAIHGNKSQNNRENALNKFKNGEIKVLIATDIAARGIDIDHITHVINYNLPEDPASYVHRIGRTARAQRKGYAISLCDGAELKLLKSIEKHIRLKIPQNLTQPYHEDIKDLQAKHQPPAPKKKLSMSKKARRRRSFKG